MHEHLRPHAVVAQPAQLGAAPLAPSPRLLQTGARRHLGHGRDGGPNPPRGGIAVRVEGLPPGPAVFHDEPDEPRLDEHERDPRNDENRDEQPVDRPRERRALLRQPPMHGAASCRSVHFAAKVKSCVFVSLPATVTEAVWVPYFSCHPSIVYVPGGNPLIEKLPSVPLTAENGCGRAPSHACLQPCTLHSSGTITSGAVNVRVELMVVG